MDRQQAQRIIKETFENPFDRGRFSGFAKNLLNRMEDDPFDYNIVRIPDSYKPHIRRYERIGKYHDGENRVDILIVHLDKETSIERARTMQRNFVAGYLQGKYGSASEKEAALVAFVAPGGVDWRFSLVKMDYRFEENKPGKIKVTEDFTPARRWSFLVGSNEASHTAQSRLMPVLADDEHNPSLKQLEEVFNIETVTREFFLKYRDLFIRTKEALDQVVRNNAKVKADFESKEVNTVDFAKKLLGQIVFLYFLQKKGWFGVERDAEWGRGSKHFLRELFKGKHGAYKNFFNDILEPLFYQALRLDRRHDDDYYDRFNCKIPFLNGGLFDPIGNYDWVHTDILLPNELFSNQIKTREGDTGNGILDIFDRYNFTVKEDEPLEKEVAIDPELLGKAYEKFNAIRPDNFAEYKKALKSGKKGDETKFNKQFGVYYTPREIVHYMCQQSLIQYLYTELNREAATYQKAGGRQIDAFGNQPKKGQLDLTVEHRPPSEISKEDLETLIKYGEQVGENEAIVEAKGRETRTYSYKLPDSIRWNAQRIDDALAGITVCDPAIGSGAFPVGMMHEIVKTRQVLSNVIQASSLNAGTTQSPGSNKEARGQDARATYHFKRECIEKSLYGVDIDPGAVEIAKLRLWLSLVVDEDDIRRIKPLPNLDYKIVCGNSLIGLPDIAMKDLELESEIERLKIEYFSETNPTNKKQLRNNIDQSFKKLVQSAREFSSNIPDADFEFKIHFSEVFHQKGGFDVVIANPPYLRIQEIQKNDPQLAKQLKVDFISAVGSFDIYACFVERAVKLICKEGNIAFILPHKFFQAAFGKNLRQLIASKKMLRKIVDFGSSQVFETATTYTCLLFLSYQNQNFDFAELKPNTTINDLPSIFDFINASKQGETDKVAITVLSSTKVSEKEWHFSTGKATKILAKLQMQPRRLSDVCEKMFQGIATSADKIYFLEHILESNGVITAYSKSLDREIQIEKDFVKPLLKGADVHRYRKLTPSIWCVFPYKIETEKASLIAQNEIKKKFPMAWEYLLQNRKALENRENGRMKHEQFYGYIYPKNLNEFKRTKVITPEISYGCNMTYDFDGLYHNTKCYSFIFNNRVKESPFFYLALLNSKLLWFFLTTTGYVLRGGYFVFKTNYLMPFPIPSELPDAEQQPFISRVDHILTITKDENYLLSPQKQAKIKGLEREIDQLVYQLYGLTAEEIAVVEDQP